MPSLPNAGRVARRAAAVEQLQVTLLLTSTEFCALDLGDHFEEGDFSTLVTLRKLRVLDSVPELQTARERATVQVVRPSAEGEPAATTNYVLHRWETRHPNPGGILFLAEGGRV